MNKQNVGFTALYIMHSIVRVFLLMILAGIFSRAFSQGQIWIEKKDMPTKRVGHSAVTFDGKIYVFGGSNTREGPAFDKLEVYDPQSDSWTGGTPMPTARANMGDCIWDGKIYLFGGGQSFFWDPLTTLEIFDPQTGTWDTTKTDMPRPRMGLTANAVDGKIYIIGGANADEVSWPEVDIYDPVADSWSRGADFPVPRFNLASAVIHNRIFAIGGHVGPPWTGYRQVDSYDPSSDTWMTVAEMLSGRKYFSGCSLDGNIYVFGGSTGHTTGDDYIPWVERYDSDSDRWTEKTSLPTPLAGSAAAAVDGKIYVFGGATNRPPEDYLVGTTYAYNPEVDGTGTIMGCTVNHTYLNPGVDTLCVTSRIVSPGNDITDAWAFIEGATLDSVALFDDGVHGDSLADDDVYGGYWPVQGGEQQYVIHVSAFLEETGHFVYLNNVRSFTTIGPLQVIDYVDGDFTERYRTQYLQVTLQNSGAQTVAENVHIQLSTSDPRVLELGAPSYVGDIEAGAQKTSAATAFKYVEDFGPDSTLIQPIQFDVRIYSNDVPYWHSSFDYVSRAVGIDQDHRTGTQKEYALQQNYPNPFNPSTSIEYTIPKLSAVEISIYNLVGQKLETLVNRNHNPGNFSIQWDGSNHSSGMYIYQIKTDDYVQLKKMLLIR